MSAYPQPKLALLGALACALLWGCGEGRQRSEAQAFLALYESIEHRSPAKVREAKLQKLTELPLSDATVAGARDECVQAHQSLLTAERENETVAQKLDQALAQSDGGALLPMESHDQLKQVLGRADKSLADARARFERCEGQVRSLSLRFGKR